jgi:hypothetical protein
MERGPTDSIPPLNGSKLAPVIAAGAVPAKTGTNRKQKGSQHSDVRYAGVLMADSMDPTVVIGAIQEASALGRGRLSDVNLINA